jgi:hypothetical protein
MSIASPTLAKAGVADVVHIHAGSRNRYEWLKKSVAVLL